jgi:hypothetical protein
MYLGSTDRTTAYVGIQTMGTLKGSRNGQVVSRSAHFSMKGLGIANLQPTDCSGGFDADQGVSCAQEYAWGTNLTYRVMEHYFYNITTPGWCQPGLISCTVVSGTVTYGGELQIGAVSYSAASYGQMQQASSFLEIPLNIGGTCASPVPMGQFIIPFKVIQGTTVPIYSATSYDRTDTQYPQTCARTYNSGLATYIHY